MEANQILIAQDLMFEWEIGKRTDNKVGKESVARAENMDLFLKQIGVK